MKQATLALSVLCLALTASCAKAPDPQPAHDVNADEAALRAKTETFLKNWNAGDLKAVASAVADDAIQMRENGPELVGKAAIMADDSTFFAGYTASETATVTEVAVWGDVAMSRGTWQEIETPKTKGAKPVTSNGKWLVIHKRAPDGSWLDWRHIYNVDHSAPAKAK